MSQLFFSIEFGGPRMAGFPGQPQVSHESRNALVEYQVETQGNARKIHSWTNAHHWKLAEIRRCLEVGAQH